jgi:hypothetical protein
MRRDRLEPRLDRLFASELTDLGFLERILAATRETQPRANVDALANQLTALTTKRQRILDAYFEGIINPTERDLRLAAIEREKQAVSRLLSRDRDSLTVRPATLAEMFAPFVEFDLLNRGQKRRLLNTLMPHIIAKDYRITGVTMHVGGTVGSHTAAGSQKNEIIYLPLEIAA